LFFSFIWIETGFGIGVGVLTAVVTGGLSIPVSVGCGIATSAPITAASVQAPSIGHYKIYKVSTYTYGKFGLRRILVDMDYEEYALGPDEAKEPELIKWDGGVFN